MKISVVIPNYNGRELLKKNLPQVLLCLPVSTEVIVVDDASTDNSIEVIKKLIEKEEKKDKKSRVKLKIVRNINNLGFSSTVNKGVREASGEVVLLLNTDVYPQAGFFESALAHFQDNEVFAVGCMQVTRRWKGRKKQGRGIGKIEKGFLVHGPGDLDRENTLWVFGGAGLFRKDIWEKLGGLITLYDPFYWEDIDLSYRALKAGYKLMFEKSSVVYHAQGRSINSAYSKDEVKKIAYRNQILFFWLNITDRIFLLQHFIYLPFHIVKAIITLDLPFLKGFACALDRLSEAVNIRERNIRLYKISDREILSRYTK